MIDKERDKRWSLFIRTRDKGACRYCGSVHASNEAAHIMPRGNKLTRYLKSNGLTLCSTFGCVLHSLHHSLKKEDRELAEQRIVSIIGKTMYDALQCIANGVAHDFEEVL